MTYRRPGGKKMNKITGNLCVLGAIGISGLLGAYIIYMTLGPGGDGIIFATVASGVVGIIAGLAGFKIAKSKFDPKPLHMEE
jgi:hypothetical protein